jgi:hypothetical protein
VVRFAANDRVIERAASCAVIRVSRIAFAAVSALSAVAVISACLVAHGAVREQGSRSKVQAQYDAEGDPVHKARILAKLGPLDMGEARANLRADNDEQALAVLEHYNDEVRKTAEALTATGVDAQRHPAGFKELQISLREFIRHLDDLILSIEVDKRQWFLAVRSDLSATQNLLFDALFPTGSDGKVLKRNKASQ